MVFDCDVGHTSVVLPPAAAAAAAVAAVDYDDGDCLKLLEGADDNCDVRHAAQAGSRNLWAEPVAGLLHSASALRCAGSKSYFRENFDQDGFRVHFGLYFCREVSGRVSSKTKSSNVV